jgi:toxin ParE1/3/4
MSFRLTREAEEDVANIYRYSFENFGDAQADTYHDGLTGCFRLLADTPLTWTRRGIYRPDVEH